MRENFNQRKFFAQVFPISIVIIVQMHGAFVGTKAALIHIKESLHSFNVIKVKTKNYYK